MPLLAHPDICTENVHFPSGPHLLHGSLTYPEADRARAAVVIAGPHPLLGGNMNNNVVRSLADGLARAGMIALRFDYRGVGASQGPRIDLAQHMAEFWRTSHVTGEVDFWHDVHAAVNFLQASDATLPLALIGYSFGCALLPHVQPQTRIAALALIAPTIGKHDYDSYLSVTTPTLTVASEDDFATDAEQLEAWSAQLSMPRQLVRRRCDSHFFRGHEPWLVETVTRFFDEHWR